MFQYTYFCPFFRIKVIAIEEKDNLNQIQQKAAEK